jgi:hypothetical protein
MTKKKKFDAAQVGTPTDAGLKPFAKVTRDNFVDLGKMMMQAQGGTGFVVVRDQHVRGTAPGTYKPSVREWGAWRAWRKSKGMSVNFMDSQGYYTVPTRWPHQFDGEWTEHRSIDAANRYQDLIEARQGKPRLALAESEGL